MDAEGRRRWLEVVRESGYYGDRPRTCWSCTSYWPMGEGFGGVGECRYYPPDSGGFGKTHSDGWCQQHSGVREDWLRERGLEIL